MEIKRPEPGEEPEQITLDVKDENSGTTISIDTVISPRKMTYIHLYLTLSGNLLYTSAHTQFSHL